MRSASAQQPLQPSDPPKSRTLGTHPLGNNAFQATILHAMLDKVECKIGLYVEVALGAILVEKPGPCSVLGSIMVNIQANADKYLINKR